ncbi:uncharacterized protein LOC126676814 isoform X2 [Mercurialis annua]|uniref:uncharacterized protein LOC126676814 isoform X2 n=1 Tax=Mercurialis annua TaxID=3986 RepID=UPI00215E9724|nr:uncharacterized protein LOC126676814 isoform X2 [Mercurialis annua]
MKTKALAVRRPDKPYRPSSSTTTSTVRALPPPITDHNLNALGEDSQKIMDVEISSDSDGGENIMDGGSSDVDLIYTCLKCRNGGNLLNCCGDGCAVCLHGSCIPCGPSYDENGKFYCPHCWYRTHRATVDEWKKKALTAKDYLVKFIDFNPVYVEKLNDGKGHGGDSKVVPVMEGENECSEHLDRTDVDGDVGKKIGEVKKDHRNDKNLKISDDDRSRELTEHKTISGTYEFEDLDDEVMEQEGQDNEQVADEVRILGGEEKALADGHQAEEDTIHDGPLHGLVGELESKSLNVSRGNQVREDNEEGMHADAPAANNMTAAVKQETNNNEIRQNKSPVHSQCTSAKDDRDRMEESISLQKSRQLKDSDKMLMFVPSPKRKRMKWTPEEEDMLKVR